MASAITRYTKLAILLHWLTAMLVIVAFPLGVYMHRLEFSPFKLQLVSYHKWLDEAAIAEKCSPSICFKAIILISPARDFAL